MCDPPYGMGAQIDGEERWAKGGAEGAAGGAAGGATGCADADAAAAAGTEGVDTGTRQPAGGAAVLRARQARVRVRVGIRLT